MKLAFLLAALLAAFVLISITYRYLSEEMIVDRCLSASHGSFDYSTMSCDQVNNHIYVSYGIRHPYDRETALVALAAFAVFLSCFRYFGSHDKTT
jgi:hypothetical protein